MKGFVFLFGCSLIVISCSCSMISLKSRKGKDFHLNNNSFNQLSGYYRNPKKDTSNLKLHRNFDFINVSENRNLVVNINSFNKNRLNLKLLNKGLVIDSLILKGKYSRGYFKLKQKWNADFIFGPLLWTLGDEMKYIGLTKDNKLVIINSGVGGTMLFLVMPIMSAGSGQVVYEYERNN